MNNNRVPYDKYGEWVDGVWLPYDDMEELWT